ncbi:hypothetical protein V6N11_010335 [Hibiscus sabdariffa]|uniref:Cullin N-terminal domain-containing protein n=1 Tax=Hibiscus sabdariffa TaxID=183260 RepID=A0ABR2PEW0_9ROSI
MSNQKKRIFQIEAFKNRVVVDPSYSEKTWNILDHAIHQNQICNQNASGLSFEELYRNAYNMVFHKFGEKLYSGLFTTMTACLQETSISLEAAQVHRERTGEAIDRGLMRNIVKMLMDLGFSVYLEEFEKPFLEVSAEFYKGESQKIMECCDCGDYLKRAEIRINEERDDCYPHDKISPQGELRLGKYAS